MTITHQEVVHLAAGRPNTDACRCASMCTHTHKHSAVTPIRLAGQDKITSLAPCLAPTHQVFLPNKSIK